MSLDISNKLAWYVLEYAKALSLIAGDKPIPEQQILIIAEDVRTSLNALIANALANAKVNQ